MEKAIVYGLGKFCKEYEKEIAGAYEVEAWADRAKEGTHRGRKIISPGEIKNYGCDRVIVMLQDMQECINVAKNLMHGGGISAERIILGHSLYGEYSRTIDEIKVLSDGKLQLRFGDVPIRVCSMDEFNNVYEIFAKNGYGHFVNNGRKSVAIDVGLNVGGASLYFANQEGVEKVYGYEPFRETFEAAACNLSQCIKSGKACIFRYGISNENAVREIGFNGDMSCGQSTLADVREHSYRKYLGWGLAAPGNERMEEIEVRKASETFGPILDEHAGCNIILKMDCEGEEYAILEELSQCGMLKKFKFIMMEWHYRGADILLECLEQSGFSWWRNDTDGNMGLIYAYNEKI